MFVAKIKNMLAVVLAIELVLAGIGAGLIGQTQASEPPHAKDEQSDKTDQERMVGNWHIINDDSARKGEMWVISEDRILMYAKHGGANGHLYSHRLDAGKDPKQIDIKVTLTNGTPIGVIKGVYALVSNAGQLELRLCLAEMGKDRPAAFPKKPGPGEVLILQRATSGASPPQAKEEQPAKSDQELVLGHWIIVNDDSKRKGEPWQINNDKLYMHANVGGFYGGHFYRLDAGKTPKQIDIFHRQGGDPNGAAVNVIKGIYVLDSDETRLVLRLCLADMGKDRPAAFPKKPRPGEVLILQRVTSGTSPPQVKQEPTLAENDQPTGAQTEQKVLTPEEAIKQRPKENVTVQFKVAAVKMGWSTGAIPKGSKTSSVWWELKDGNNFCIVLKGGPTYQLEQLRIDTVTHFTGKVVRATGLVVGEKPPFCIAVDDLDQLEVVLQPIAKEQPPKKKDLPTSAQTEQRVLTPEEAIKQRSKEKVTVQFKVAAVQDESRSPGGGFGQGFILLKDDSRFSVRLVPPAMYTLMRLDIEPVKHFSGKVVRVTGLVQPDHTGSSFHIRVDDLNQSQFTFVKE
ncbi:MAG TPA: hypothetical protein VFB96_04535 [Pirellulaceae bacterium]|nr:hypothetical protein [Pirellulaceae bacterium]